MLKILSPNHALRFVFVLYLQSLAVEKAAVVVAQNTTVEVNVGVVLDLKEWLGKMGLSCIKMALSDFYVNHADYKTRIVLNTRDSNNDVVRAASAALDLIRNEEVQAILGPITSMQADFVISLGQKAQVPIISFTATSPSLTSRSNYFFRATVNDSSQVTAISSLIQAYGWREAVPIYVDNEFGEGVIPCLTDALQSIDVKVPYRSAISPSATDEQIGEELYKLMTMQTRVFIVHMAPLLASQLFAKAKEIGMMNAGYVWIITDGLTDLLATLKPSEIDSMQGVLGVKPYVPRNKNLETFRARWKKKFLQDNPDIVDPELNVYGLWACDAAVALAIAIEKSGEKNLGFRNANVSTNSTDLDSLKVSINGPNLLQRLENASFNGLTGKFSFVNGQLQAPVFQIVNLNGDRERTIGFWTSSRGLFKNWKSSSEASTDNTLGKSSLGTIIWPGDTTFVPKGWEIPTNGKRLRIVVPVKNGFSEFVKVTVDPSTSTTQVEGYSIEVFKAVVDALPYAVRYDFIPFADSSGQSAGTYNDMIYQVYLGKYDAAVGDTTIVYNRSRFVDFTLPYTESGVQMLVPIRDNSSKNAWVFLKPLTWDLWLAIVCFFMFIGFVVWVLEHRINEDFRGPPSHQVGTSFWFSFSTMVFAHKENVISNLARIVIIIWCFVVLILTQAYTASLTSLLTVQQLQPTVTNSNQLIRNGEYVGYQQGSFVPGFLKKVGFDEKKLRMYKSPEECDELLQKGTHNGGISVAFDEVPYIKLILSKYCSKYTMTQPSFKTDGFGFVFPIGSPLVSDISKAILNVTEGDTMKQIEAAAFEQHDCFDTNPSICSSSLGLNSFWGLFLIVGIVASTALLIFAATFVYEHRTVFKTSSSDSKPSLWRRVLNLLRIYNEKDLSSHIFRKRELNDRVVFNLSPSIGAPSPSTYSVQTDFNVEQGTPTEENVHSSHQQLQKVIICAELTNLNQETSTTTIN